ncbi:MAG: hypothetical protein Tsb0020_16580 [Haliangiales bacterium]
MSNKSAPTARLARPEYFDVLISLGPEYHSYHDVEIRLGDGGIFRGGRLELDRFGLNHSALSFDDQAYGQKLYQALLATPSMQKAYQQAVGAVRSKRTPYDGLRVRLAIHEDAPALHKLSWERIYHQHEQHWGALACAARTPFSRYIALETPHPPAAPSGPLRFLFVIAHPAGAEQVLAPIDVDAEVENLCAALADVDRTRLGQLAIMPGRSGLSDERLRALAEADIEVIEGPSCIANITAALQSGADVFHLLGHGHLDAEPQIAYLHLEDDEGGWARVSDQELASKIIDLETPPRLVFLATCESAARDSTDAFVGIAPKLVRAQVPAVVAMQERVRMGDAQTLVRHFYRNLFTHGVVDLALNQARSLLHKPGRFDWAIPALFTRLDDGRLFTHSAPSLSPSSSSPSQAQASLPSPSSQASTSTRRSRASVMWLGSVALSGLVLAALVWALGARALRARELLIGIAPETLRYSAGAEFTAGLLAVPRMVQFALIGPLVGLGIERWAAMALVALAIGGWWLRATRRSTWLLIWLAMLMPALGVGAVMHAHAARVDYAVLAPPRNQALAACDPGPSLPQQIRFEVCSWLRNPSPINEGRRQALAGLSVWLTLFIAAATALALATAETLPRRSRRQRLAAAMAIGYAVLMMYTGLQIPRTYAMARWGLKYTGVSDIARSCSAIPGLRVAIANGTCQAVDISADASSDAIIVWGVGCPAQGNVVPGSAYLVELERPSASRCVRTQSGQAQTILGSASGSTHE